MRQHFSRWLVLSLAALVVGLLVVPTAALVLAPQAAFAQDDQDPSPAAGPEAGTASAAAAPVAKESVTPSASAAPAETPTEKPSASATPTGEPSASATPTEEPSASATPTEKPSASATPTEKPSASATPTGTSPAPATTASAPTIASELADYAPGGTVTLTGVGWQAGEVVTIIVNDTGGLSWSLTQKVVADAEGRLTLTFVLPNHYVPDYDVTATGELSGVATTTFTDASQPYYFWMTQSVPAATTPVTGGAAITYNLFGRRNGTNDVTDATITLKLTGSATFNNSGQPTTVYYIDSTTVRWKPASLGDGSTTVGIKATVTTGAAAGLITATVSGDANGTFYIGDTARVGSLIHSVTGKCSFATGSGDFSRSICWFDLAGYNPTLAATTAGQSMQQNLLNGYVLSYSIKATGTSTNVVAWAPPTYSAAFLGNTAAGYSNNYQGMQGKPALYQQQTGAGTTTLSLSNISLKDSAGTVVTGFALVGADAESTDSGESITWTSDKVFTSIGPLGNSCGGTLVMSAGSTQAACNAGPVANKTGAAILYTLDPTSFTQTMVGTGLQAVAFGVMVSGLQLNKQIVNKVPGDQFRISVKRSDNTEAGFALTDLTTGFAATDQIYTISSGSSQTFTLSEAPVGSTNPLNYATSWACTKNGVAFTPTNVSGSIKTAAVTMSDFVTCTITNTGPSVTLRKTTTGVAGGPFGFTLTNTTQASGSVTTTTAGTAAHVDGATSTAGTQPFTVSAIGTEVKITDGSSAGWQLSSAICVNSLGTTVGSLTGSVYTIPAASVGAGSAFTCDFTSSRILPTVTLRKTTTGVAGGPFAFTLTNTTQPSGSVTTSAPGTPAQVGTFTVSSFGAQVTITEGAQAGWVLASATCKNASNTVVGTLSGSAYTIPASDLIAGAVITCDYTNRPYAGTVSWSKVDAGSTSTLLTGSEWTLTGPSYPAYGIPVADCTLSPCAGPDADPVAGQFRVPVLSGTHTLVEKTAPIGFQLDATTHTFAIATDGQVLGLGAFANKRSPVPALPLTGGASTDAFLLVGYALMAAAGFAGWRNRRRLVRSF